MPHRSSKQMKKLLETHFLQSMVLTPHPTSRFRHSRFKTKKWYHKKMKRNLYLHTMSPWQKTTTQTKLSYFRQTNKLTTNTNKTCTYKN